MQPFFSIILPTYNRERFIETAVKSVLEQVYVDWELLIIDDGSTDTTSKIIKRIAADARIKYIYQPNQERSCARNKGIAMALGAFICFLDSDDYYLQNHLSILHQIIQLENKKPALYYTNYYIKNEVHTRKSKGFSAMKNKGIYNIFFEELLQTNSVCVAAELLMEDRFPEQFNLFEDNHLWLRIIARSEMIYCKTPTTVFCNHSDRSLMVSAEKLKQKGQKYMEVLRNLFDSEKYPLLNKQITRREKQLFIASKMIVLSFEALNQKDFFLVYHFLFQSFRYCFNLKKIITYLKLFLGTPFFILFKQFGGRTQHVKK